MRWVRAVFLLIARIKDRGKGKKKVVIAKVVKGPLLLVGWDHSSGSMLERTMMLFMELGDDQPDSKKMHVSLLWKLEQISLTT